MESEGFIRTITDHLPAFITYWDATLRCRFVNKPYLDWLGMEMDEMMTLTKPELLGREEYELQRAHIAAVLKGVPQHFERNFYKPNGTKIFTHTQYLPDQEGGTIKGFYSIVYDVTAVKQMESLLIKATDLARMGSWEVDLRTNVTYWSDSTKVILEVPPDFEPGLETGIQFYKTGLSQDTIREKIDDLLRDGTPFDVELEIVTYKGNDKWIRVIGEAEFTATGCIRLYGSFQDVHDQKTAELSALKALNEKKLAEIQLKELNQDLQEHAQKLAASNAELEQFAYVASHDLQEPLRMVTSFVNQIEKKYGNLIDDKGRQYIHFAVDGAKRMRQIILDLLDYSRVGRANVEEEDVDTETVVRNILALYRKKIADQNATVSFEGLPVIQSSEVPIRQVFQNLISNSLKYHKAGQKPQVRISCEPDGAYWKFAVSDNGIGIDPQYFEKIFVIFQRLHLKEEYAGSGMGLAITRKIVENLGGKIWVTSEPGKGSTFYFTILKLKHHENHPHLTG